MNNLFISQNIQIEELTLSDWVCNSCGYVEQSILMPTSACPICKSINWSKK